MSKGKKPGKAGPSAKRKKLAVTKKTLKDLGPQGGSVRGGAAIGSAMRMASTSIKTVETVRPDYGF